jgi:hypothetical protein
MTTNTLSGNLGADQPRFVTDGSSRLRTVGQCVSVSFPARRDPRIISFCAFVTAAGWRLGERVGDLLVATAGQDGG